MGLFSSQIAAKRLAPLCRKMATAYDAGVPILNTLELVTRQEKDFQLRRVLRQMCDDVRNGATLGEAARAQSKYLPSYLIELLASGEIGGNLETMLRDVADYFEHRVEMNRQITRALTGPAIRLAAAWFLGTFAFRLLAVIKELAAQDGRVDFDFAGFMGDYWRFQFYAFLLFGTVFIICVVLSRMGLFGWVTGIFSTFIWPFSRVTRKFALARFFRTLALLLTSGIRIDQCIAKAAASTSNPYLERDLLRVVPHVMAGESLVDAFTASRHLTSLAREMLQVGEQSGKLSESLLKVAQYHMEEASHAVQVATKFLTVVIILGVAFLIGYIVITFFGTLYATLLDSFTT